jgi:hypothetical protein
MRILLLLLVVAATALPAQVRSVEPKRWDVGAAMLFGFEPMIGATFGVRAVDARFFHLAVELSGFRHFGALGGRICLYGEGGCGPEPEPGTPSLLGTLALRAAVPLASRVYLLAEGGVTRGEWTHPGGGTASRPSTGVGIGRESESAAHAIEVRWQRIGAPSSVETAWRVGWSYRW